MTCFFILYWVQQTYIQSSPSTPCMAFEWIPCCFKSTNTVFDSTSLFLAAILPTTISYWKSFQKGKIWSCMTKICGLIAYVCTRNSPNLNFKKRQRRILIAAMQCKNRNKKWGRMSLFCASDPSISFARSVILCNYPCPFQTICFLVLCMMTLHFLLLINISIY